MQQRTIRKLPPGKLPEVRKKRVAAYARVSTGKLAALESLAAQLSYYNGLIQKRADWAFAGIFYDGGVSGTKAERGGFQDLLAACREGKIDMVITKSVSRFARNTALLLEVTRELKNLGVDVYFEEQNIHTASAEGEMLLSIMAACAQEESRVVSENCKWRIRRNYGNGISKAGLRVYGYRSCGTKYELVPQEAQMVRCIFGWYLMGDGILTIARRLNRSGSCTSTGKAWSPQAVRYVLTNERYVGDALLQKKYIADHVTKKILRNRGELTQYYVTDIGEAIVGREIFECVQTRLDERVKKYSPEKPGARIHPFTGFLICGLCGKSYKRKVAHDRASWNCGSLLRNGKAACSGKQIPERILERITSEVVGTETFSETAMRQKLARILVLSEHMLTFVFPDGRSVERTWESPSRRESWDAAARERAREHTKKRWKK